MHRVGKLQPVEGGYGGHQLVEAGAALSHRLDIQDNEEVALQMVELGLVHRGGRMQQPIHVNVAPRVLSVCADVAQYLFKFSFSAGVQGFALAFAPGAPAGATA